MSSAVATIVRLERRVMWRRRLLSLQEGLALAVGIGGVLAAGLVVLIRVRPINAPVWVVITGALVLSSASALVRWFFTRAQEGDAAFLIDKLLGLEDRVATSHLIIERGGPNGALEEALIEDTAARAACHPPSSIVPFTIGQRHALPLAALIALAAALMITPRSLPVTEAMAAERADIENAAELLERSSIEIESVPAETETARLASEQAALGRGFRQPTTKRAEALRRLSGLEDRIRRRHDDLASTRADEIVDLADRRLGGALSSLVDNEKKQESGVPQNKPQEPHSGTDPRVDAVKTAPEGPGQTGDSADKTQADKTQGDLKPAVPKQNNQKPGAQKGIDREKGDQQPSDKSTSGSDALKASNFLVNQAAKALPKLSEDLLKKAAQLRANELSPADIEKLRLAAESLGRELSQFAQSKDLQQALQEMARQVRPEQVEQVARELGNQEKLKQELESAARLLAENHQAKEMVAGLAGEFARVRGEMRRQQNSQEAGQQGGDKSGLRSGQSGGRDQDLRSGGARAQSGVPTAADRRLAGQGREARLQGKLRQSSRGDYLYLQSKAEAGAARAPYSSAYPKYRREAERSVQRTQVPSNLRSVVRKYFDAINPDSKR